LDFNHRQIQRIILTLQKLKKAIIFVDFTKAFDLLEHSTVKTYHATSLQSMCIVVDHPVIDTSQYGCIAKNLVLVNRILIKLPRNSHSAVSA
jgi:hypothetical protein